MGCSPLAANAFRAPGVAMSRPSKNSRLPKAMAPVVRKTTGASASDYECFLAASSVETTRACGSVEASLASSSATRYFSTVASLTGFGFTGSVAV